MIDHMSLVVSDLKMSKKFYEKALKPLGYKLTSESIASPNSPAAGFCIEDKNGKRDFWIKQSSSKPTSSVSCIAFKAKSKEVVNEFYKAALAAGGTDNGSPGYRSYETGYYAAYVLDPDNLNIEAVFDDPNPS